MGRRVRLQLTSALAACLLILAAAGPSAATATVVIDTTAEEYGTVSFFGLPPNSIFYGQTVQVPEGFPLLSSYAFRIQDDSNLIFRGAVYAYTPGEFPGEPLWVGPAIQLGASGTTVTITFTPNLRLDPGTTYAIGATTAFDLDQPSAFTSWSISPNESYPDGTLVYFTQGSRWSVMAEDMAFRATFSAPGNGDGGVIAPVEYALGFNANGGTCNLTNSGPIIDGTWITVPTAQQCTRPGYTLLGWNPRADGGDPLGFNPGGWTVMTGDNTLYAIWVPIR
jgi:hypothetical protein